MIQKKFYKYKIKHGFLKEENKMLALGFNVGNIESEEGKVFFFDIMLNEDGNIAKFIKSALTKQREGIQKSLLVNSGDNEDKEIKDLAIEVLDEFDKLGYKFDPKTGELLNLLPSDLHAQVCVLSNGDMFVNVQGYVEFYDTETLDSEEQIKEAIKKLESKGAVYKKRLKVE